MTDIDNLIERLEEYFGRFPNTGRAHHLGMDAADALDAYRKATGGLSPELVAKALDIAARRAWLPGLTFDEIDALRAATFEEPT